MSSAPLPLPSELASSYHIPRWHGSALPMLFGPLSGQRWLPFSGGKILRLLLGRYESDQSAAIQRSLSPGDVFYDVGAATGYYSLLAARVVGVTGKVIALEPNPRNAAFLRRHVAINGLGNVVIHQTAVANSDGWCSFACGTGTGTGHLSERGTSTVRVCRLDDLVRSGPAPTHLKIDVEGAERDVLEGAAETLAQIRPTIFLSLHGEAMQLACGQFLRQLGYRLSPLSPDPKHADEVLCTPV